MRVRIRFAVETGRPPKTHRLRPELDAGLILSLYPRSDLAKDAEISIGAPQSGEFSVAQLVSSRAEVEKLLQDAKAAGAMITPAHARPWGIYSGYFRDPDGHLWEIRLL